MEKDIDLTRKMAGLKINGYCHEDVNITAMRKEGQVINDAEQILEIHDSIDKVNHHKSCFLEELPLASIDGVPVVGNMESKPSPVTFILQNTEATDTLKTLSVSYPFALTGLNHVAFCCENLERTLEFYCGLLGLKASLDRPDLQYRGAWLNLGAEGVHIMEVVNPDPVSDRPEHGGYDRHACINCNNVENLKRSLDNAGIPYQLSLIPSLFCRDPDGNGLEFIQKE